MGFIHTGLDIILLVMIAYVIMKLDVMQRTIDLLLPPVAETQEPPAETSETP
ncbi:MAG TPA: hypothetical protein VG387_02825 [Rhizomicrobium sp.]|jgi:hypothetical protein|nr:hypothetical protein [Rhizomicrobium sp.]